MVDIKGLQVVYDANIDIPQEEFDMTEWNSCLIGNFCKKNPDDRLKLSYDRICLDVEDRVLIDGEAIITRFNMDEIDAEFIFAAYMNRNKSKEEILQKLQSFIANMKFLYKINN